MSSLPVPESSKRAVGRPAGTRNPDHDVKKRALARKLLAAVVASGGRPSLHDLARTAGTSIPTINHYFGERSSAIAEALRTVEADAVEYLNEVATPSDEKLQASLQTVAQNFARAWTDFGVGALFTAGMTAGLADPVAGPGYLDGVLEPTLQAIETRLRIHAERGEMDIAATDELAIRIAALAFISPVILALMHQNDLSGDRCRPLDMDAFIRRHVERFVRAYDMVE
ncbi:MAG: hypothetical protein ACKVVP_16315 [Chloroflexota bacterium]